MRIAGEGSLRASENFGHKESLYSPPHLLQHTHTHTYKEDFWGVLGSFEETLGRTSGEGSDCTADSNTSAGLLQ